VLDKTEVIRNENFDLSFCQAYGLGGLVSCVRMMSAYLPDFGYTGELFVEVAMVSRFFFLKMHNKKVFQVTREVLIFGENKCVLFVSIGLYAEAEYIMDCYSITVWTRMSGILA
jgi:hypothetical protein